MATMPFLISCAMLAESVPRLASRSSRRMFCSNTGAEVRLLSTTTTCDCARVFTGKMLARSVVAPPREVFSKISRLVTGWPLLAASRISLGSGAGSEFTGAFRSRAALARKCAAASAVQAAMRPRASTTSTPHARHSCKRLAGLPVGSPPLFLS